MYIHVINTKPIYVKELISINAHYILLYSLISGCSLYIYMCKKELIFITDFQENSFIIEQNRLRSLKLFRKTLIAWPLSGWPGPVKF